MRRADRLFDLIQILRDGRLHAARDLAARLEVSVRTIWRDMAVLQASGLPVEGARGLGYMLRETIDLPPLTLTPDELEALRLGAELVARGADPGLGRAAESLRGKIEAVLPDRRLADARTPLPYVFTGAETAAGASHLPAIRRALANRETLRIDYRDADGRPVSRRVRPLQLQFWGRVWTLAGWCELRGDFRSFRLDRIAGLDPTGEGFAAEPGRGLDDYLASVEAREGR